MPLADFTEFTFADGDISHRVFKKGTGPGVVVLHELPGMTPECIALGEAIAASGFTAHLPLLFGEPGDNHPVFFIAKLCISREFRLFASGGGSPIVDWLRALCRKVRADCGGLGVGAIGLCLTGNFAISLMADDSVLAPVASEPSLPLFAMTKKAKAALAVTNDELAQAKRRNISGVPLMCLRFSEDSISPRERYAAIAAAFAPNFKGIQIDSSAGNQWGISPKAHAVLTTEFVDKPGHPTKLAREQVVQFLKEQLGGGERQA